MRQYFFTELSQIIYRLAKFLPTLRIIFLQMNEQSFLRKDEGYLFLNKLKLIFSFEG